MTMILYLTLAINNNSLVGIKDKIATMLLYYYCYKLTCGYRYHQLNVTSFNSPHLTIVDIHIYAVSMVTVSLQGVCLPVYSQ